MSTTVTYDYDFPGELRECDADDISMIAVIKITRGDINIEFTPGELQSIDWNALANAAEGQTTHRESPDVSNYNGEIEVAGDTVTFNSSSWSGGHSLRIRVPSPACVGVFRDIAARCAEFAADPIGAANKHAR